MRGQEEPPSEFGSMVARRMCVAVLAVIVGMAAHDSDAFQVQPRMGEPILGLDRGQFERFERGRDAFDRIFEAKDGLGPVFNHISCSACHDEPRGGAGRITVTRAGRLDKFGFDPLVELGGSLFQEDAIDEACAEVIPEEANVVAFRLTNGMLGYGLVEAILDANIQELADNPPPGISGRTHLVKDLDDPDGPLRVGRFGWKAQQPTMLSFSADAALNEMGITNRFFLEDNDPNGVNPPDLADCDFVSDPEDGPDAEGFHFIDRVTDFMRFLAPPPQTPKTGMSGEGVFESIGCTDCHVAAFTTPDDQGLEDALRGKVVKPYSDFLLHDVGDAGDFIVQGDADLTELRTPPLMGVRFRARLWHDGRFDDPNFSTRVTNAIEAHGAPNSEGEASAISWGALSQTDKDAVIAFMDSLGRAEFDATGDNNIDLTDYALFTDCLTGPGGGPYSPDDACSVSDIDQDGDVDLFDAANLMIAFTGS